MASYCSLGAYTCEKIEVCSISLSMLNRIRLIGLPAEMVHPIREAILTGWGRIEEERDYYGTHEFEVSGIPWFGYGEEGVRSRRLITAIIMAMARNGWNILQALDVCNTKGDKDTLFFEPGIPYPEVQMFSMSFNMGDRIRVIDAPSLFPAVKQAVASQWRKGIQKEKEYHGALELKLVGNPWYATGSETVYSRMVLCEVIANLRSLGYKLYVSVDICFERRAVESFVFRKVNSIWQ